MLTRQGWLVAATSVAAVVAGRLLGIFELFLLGAGGAVVVGVAAVTVGLARMRLDVARELHPRRVHAGTPSRVDLRVRNLGRRRTPLLSLRDPVGHGQAAQVMLAPITPGHTMRAAYRLPTGQRGLLSIGPLQIEVSDPFGLAALRTPGAPATELTIYPAVDDIRPLPHTRGDDPHGGADHRNSLSTSGEDFYALRAYQVGDDLRRVHWPATARHDELMVRQDEMPWQGRATILLDVRSAAHTPRTLERAVSAAASVVVACRRRRFLLRLVITDGTDTGFGAGHAHIDAIMERLATVAPTEDAGLAGSLATLRRGGGGSLVMLLGGSDDQPAVPRLGGAFSTVTTLMFVSGPEGGAPPWKGVVVVDDATSFPDAWDGAIARARTGSGAVAR